MMELYDLRWTTKDVVYNSGSNYVLKDDKPSILV